MPIDTQAITKLRQATGAGVADVKSALEEAGGDDQKAIEILRKKGALKAAKKMAERTTGEGVVDAYIHSNGKVGVLIQLQCETDFVARTDDFKSLAHDISLHVAAANPLYLKPEDVPAEEVAKEKEIYQVQLKAEGKPAAMMEKIIAGKVEKYYQDVCLLKQIFVKDDSITIEKLIEQAVAKMGEKIELVRFVRLKI